MIVKGCRIAAMLLLLVAGPAAAQTTSDVTFHNANHFWGGVGVGPYTLSIPGLAGSTVDAYCVDYAHHVYYGDQWTAYLSPLSGDLAKTRLGYAGDAYAADKYLKAAYLATKFSQVSTSDWGYIHAAIWQITGNYTPWGNLSGNTTVAGYMTEASQWLSTADRDAMSQYWYVVTDTEAQGNLYGKQEFLVHVTPEPEVWLMFATGLIGVLGVAVTRGRFLG